jgi:hypothetical protein
MRRALRRISWIVAMILASMVGTVPGCASMGGGMKSVLDPPALQDLSALI